ncbi:MAG TPA: DUF3253 domain-containing protein [Acidimicrobiales bacterium]|nr:DUF3253 domain-containing protein [Acidimicrobiales bacterium]
MADREPERTEDGRYVVVDGRRWRASDPAIPEVLRQQLVDELMDARRAVGPAKRSGDDEAEVAARARVQAAKVALGERGQPWWEPPTDAGRRQRLEAAVLALAHRRAPDKTICPSDAARAVGGEAWRDDMDLARDVVRALAADGRVEVLQRGEPVPADADWKGPIRVRYSGGGAAPA